VTGVYRGTSHVFCPMTVRRLDELLGSLAQQRVLGASDWLLAHRSGQDADALAGA
jgi:hypothetical protein